MSVAVCLLFYSFTVAVLGPRLLTRLMTRVAGRHIDGLEAVVLDAPQRVAYCVPGRPNTIVVTSAAVTALDARHLDAVLSHERAHLAGRHHLILALTGGLATILPRVKLVTIGALGASGVGVLARATRLATPPRPAQRIRVRLMLAAVSTLLAIGPLVTVLLTASGVAMCGPVIG